MVCRSYTRCTISSTHKKKETFSERDDCHVFRIKIRLRPLVPTARISRLVALPQVLLDRDPSALHRVVLASPVRLQTQMDACLCLCLPTGYAGSAFHARQSSP